MKPVALPKAIVVPVPKDLYNVEYDSKTSGVNEIKIILLKNLNVTNPSIRNLSFQYQIIKTAIVDVIVPISIIGSLPILSIKNITNITAGISIITV